MSLIISVIGFAAVAMLIHELGHLLFGMPDLYDTDNSSEGIGNWCLMAGGTWNNGVYFSKRREFN